MDRARDDLLDIEDGFIDLLAGPKNAEFALLTVAVFMVDVSKDCKSTTHYYDALSCLAEASFSTVIQY